MNNEETIIDPQYSNAKTQKSETTSVERPKTEEKKNIGAKVQNIIKETYFKNKELV